MVPSPSVSRERVPKRLLVALTQWIEGHGLGEIHSSPLDAILSEYDVVQPDLVCVSKERSSIIKEANIWGAPDLVVEILSPDTARWDQGGQAPAVRALRSARALACRSSGLKRRGCDPQGRSLPNLASVLRRCHSDQSLVARVYAGRRAPLCLALISDGTWCQSSFRHRVLS